MRTSCSRIAEQVADHAHAARLRQFDQHDDVGPVAVQRRMHRMVRRAPSCRCGRAAPPPPSRGRRQWQWWQIHSGPHCMVPQPLQRWITSLPSRRPSQYGLGQRLLGRARAGRRAEAVASCSQRGLRAEDQAAHRRDHRPADDERRRRAPATWLVAVPRTWRTASITSLEARACSTRPGCRRWCSAACGPSAHSRLSSTRNSFASSGLNEAVLDQGHQHAAGEVLVGLHDVHVLRAHAGHRVQLLRHRRRSAAQA